MADRVIKLRDGMIERIISMKTRSPQKILTGKGDNDEKSSC